MPENDVLFFEGDAVLDFINSLHESNSKKDFIELIEEEDTKGLTFGIINVLDNDVEVKHIVYLRKFPTTLMCIAGKATAIRELVSKYKEQEMIEEDEYIYINNRITHIVANDEEFL